MEYRRLGRTELSASVIGFGCNRIARDRSLGRRSEVVATLENAFARGINLFDTANSYDGGDSERLLGKVFRSQRHRIILCSKAGYRSWPLLILDKAAPSWSRRIPRRGRRREGRSTRDAIAPPSRRAFDPAFLRLAVEGSLRRLETDYLDIFYLHSPPPEILTDDAVFATLAELQRDGWLRHYGVSFSDRATTDQILAGLERPGISVVQFSVNPLGSADPERIASAARQRGVAVVGRQPFGRGAAFQAPEMRAVLATRGRRTPAQTLLRSALQRRGIDVILVGMTTRQHLDENLEALSAPPLSADELQRLFSTTWMR